VLTDQVLRIADSAAELGATLAVLGQHIEAERLLRQAIAIYEENWGRDDPRFAGALYALGTTCAARGRLTEAEQFYHRALRTVTTQALESR